jgi:hypothetical protein
MFGKLIDGNLVVAGNTIKDGDKIITNPSDNLLIYLGYKEIVYCDKPNYDKENEKLIEVYAYGDEPYTDKLYVSYEKVKLSPAEHNAIIKQEIVEEEKKTTDRNYREAIKDLKAKKETHAIFFLPKYTQFKKTI